MEMFGGFMVMMSILSFFMVLIWLVMPFVVFTVKGKLDRTLDVLAGIEQRLTNIESALRELQAEPGNSGGGEQVASLLSQQGDSEGVNTD